MNYNKESNAALKNAGLDFWRHKWRTAQSHLGTAEAAAQGQRDEMDHEA